MRNITKRIIALCLSVLLCLPFQCISVFAADGGWKENYFHDKNQPIYAGDYRIVSVKDSSKCIDIASGSLSNNANVILHSKGTYNASQIFRFTYIGDGYYRIMNLNCDKYLTVNYSSKKAGEKLIMYSKKSSDNQLWKLEKTSDGHWRIISKISKLLVDIKNGKLSDGTLIQQWTKNDTPAQKWDLYQTNITSQMSISNAGKPSEIIKGKTWSCTGKITSNYKIKTVTGEIVGSPYHKTDDVNKGTYDLKDSKIDKALLFNKLSKGNYTYKISAKDMSGKTKVLVNQSFKVVTSPTSSGGSSSSSGLSVTKYVHLTHHMGKYSLNQHSYKKFDTKDGNQGCCSTCYAIGLSIVTKKAYNPTSFGLICNWSKGHIGGYKDYNAKSIYNKLEKNLPTMVHYGNHWVLVIGLKVV